MDSAEERAARLRQQIAKAEAELKALKAQLAQVESAREERGPETSGVDGTAAVWKWPLSAAEYERYGRQLVLPHVGINGQKRLKASRVLVVGAGGLGCPAAAYLAGAGVGTLGVVDGDVVEPSNLHRQIAHGTSRVGDWKVDSLIAYCVELNPLPRYVPYREHLTPENAEAIVAGYDLVLDCTDHPTSRYLISDACVLLQKPLVSASALRADGQLMLLNTPPTPQGVLDLAGDVAGGDGGGGGRPPGRPAPPCYRCVFPRPPPPDAVVGCGEGGVLGPAVGVMGVLQALEAVKVVAAGLHLAADATGGGAAAATTVAPPTLLLFSGGAAVGAPTFRSVRMRPRRRECLACGEGTGPGGGARLTLGALRRGLVDYVAFCGGDGAGPTAGLPLGEGERVSARDYHERLRGGGDAVAGAPHLLLDVRERELFDVASIEGAVNVPYSRIRSAVAVAAAAARRREQCDGKDAGQEEEEEDGQGRAAPPEWLPPGVPADAPIYVVCRVGNDSQLVARELIDAGLGRGGERWIGDIRGGMRAWRDEVDGTLPFL